MIIGLFSPFNPVERTLKCCQADGQQCTGANGYSDSTSQYGYLVL